MTRLLLFILLIPSLCLLSCKQDGKSRTAVQTTDFEIPEPPKTPTPQEEPEAREQDFPPEALMREACLNGETRIIEQLIQEGQDVNAEDEEGRTGLMLASFNGHKEIVEILLRNKARVNHTDFLGRSALMYASTGHFPETVALLLSQGADPNLIDSEEGFTALMFAGAEGNIKVVRLLLEHGANPKLKDKDGDTAESFARQNGHLEVADLLKQSM